MVLVHGIGSSGAYFGPLSRLLAQRWRVVVPDLAGHGRSPQPARPLTVDEHAASVARVLADLATTSPTGAPAPLLLGHSLGCQVAAALVAAHPRAARAAVLLGPTTDDRARSALRQGLRLARNSVREPVSLAPVQAASYLRCGPRTYLGTVGPMLSDRIEDHLAAAAVPVLVARGQHDPVAPRGWLARLALRVPRASLVGATEVPGAHHVAQWSHPGPVAELVEAAAAT
ncbi:alpha/beta fold hydrolase [Streptomyces sp. NP160]|uniref:alpha/beta fold hydrolase n=1 Tax=Streptomyces sp. NP160 TaxID=2586637 RepID=UPI0015D5FCD8|nr:alpha/beta hydrolase [Streptomyces sp. NP160]